MPKLVKWNAASGTVTITNISGANTDLELVDLWLTQKQSPHTRRAYARYASQLLAHVGKPLRSITLRDLQKYIATLKGADASRVTHVNALKSILSFAHRVGYTPANVGASVSLPGLKNTISQRIVSEVDVHRMLAQEPKARNKVLLRLLYGSGARVSEISQLKWRDLQANGDAGQVLLYGKGRKTRVVLLSAATWVELTELRSNASDDDPVFVSRKHQGPLKPSSIRLVVYNAAARIGIHAAPHWLRHAHASHALDHGAPIHLVQATLGHASVATTGRYLHARPTDSSARFLSV